MVNQFRPKKLVGINKKCQNLMGIQYFSRKPQEFSSARTHNGSRQWATWANDGYNVRQRVERRTQIWSNVSHSWQWAHGRWQTNLPRGRQTLEWATTLEMETTTVAKRRVERKDFGGECRMTWWGRSWKFDFFLFFFRACFPRPNIYIHLFNEISEEI